MLPEALKSENSEMLFITLVFLIDQVNSLTDIKQFQFNNLIKFLASQLKQIKPKEKSQKDRDIILCGII